MPENANTRCKRKRIGCFLYVQKHRLPTMYRCCQWYVIGKLVLLFLGKQKDHPGGWVVLLSEPGEGGLVR